uniref:Interleukin 19 like n=1 Tax=Oryzias melastigma TaxID=30732 RepID=A0A3B3CLC1_ORYME
MFLGFSNIKKHTPFLLLFLSLCILLLSAESRTLHADSCSFNVHTHELRKYYSDVRSHAVKFVCKFLPKLCIHFSPSEPHQLRCSSALANAFVSIRRDMHKCHCHCGEETQRQIDSMHTEFDKLQIQEAAQKAVGELNTVLDWLEGLGHKTQN